MFGLFFFEGGGVVNRTALMSCISNNDNLYFGTSLIHRYYRYKIKIKGRNSNTEKVLIDWPRDILKISLVVSSIMKGYVLCTLSTFNLLCSKLNFLSLKYGWWKRAI